jgi:2-polyprenyl-3-methyl-5-hydroxy-6-metoxy-1,4-benzoquinol methylase
MNLFRVFFASSDDKNSIGARFRRLRFKNFENFVKEHFNDNEKLHILDVGGKAYFWNDTSIISRPNTTITLLNLSPEKVNHPALKSITGDATNLSEFNDKHFDLVFSNSVIEHLYTKENQEKMAKECVRVGKKFYIQTPNKHFIIEPHYALPFFQYLPNSLAFIILTKTPFSRLNKWKEEEAKQYLQEIRLISESDMKKLFPGAKIYKEKFLGMSKSFTAHNM